MPQHSKPLKALDKVDPVWARIRAEGEDVVRREPEVATFLFSSILHHDTLESAVAHRIAERLDHQDVSAELIRQAYADALE
ncbi:MAG TPA: serine O-acetyltransferase, partial [Xanthobacteraceae bacterium]